MISTRKNYSYLLVKLREMANMKDDELENIEKEDFIIYSMFYKFYTYAYAYMLRTQDNKNLLINKKMVDRALSDFGVFNYFINVCVGEYSIYDDIGTGKVTYIPYQGLSDFFFENDKKKEILMNYLKTELKDVFEEENNLVRVKK